MWDNSKNTDKDDEEDAREVQDDFYYQHTTGADDLMCSDGHGEDSILDQDYTVLRVFGLTTENAESSNDNQEKCGESLLVTSEYSKMSYMNSAP